MLAAKRLLQKAAQRDHHLQSNVGDTSLKQSEVEFKIAYHYGIPSAASLLAFDPIQRLLAIATLDGKVKVMGDEGIEALFISPKQLPYKYIEFLQNHGFIVGVSSENEIQVWNLESRSLACCMQWESDITAFSVISGSCFLYIGDVCAMISVLKYDGEANNLLQLPYCMSADSLNEAAGLQSPANQLIVGILPQPCSSGNNVLIAYENGILILWDALKAHILFVGGSKDLQLQDECVDSQNEVDANDPNSALDHFPDKEISSLCWASSNGSILAVGYVDGDIMFWKTPSASNNDSQQKKVSNSNVVKLQLSSAERRLPVIGLHWSTNEISNNVSNGKLFIYGGDEIGAEEVVTVLTLEWSSRMESLTCIGRLDLTLPGLFADMILVPAAGPTGSNYKAALFVLTSPGQLHVCENDSLSVLVSQQERKKSTFGMEFPALIPITDPRLTAAKFISLPIVGSTAKIQSGIASFKKHGCSPAKVNSTKWPLTGGIPSQASLTEDTIIKRMYVAGYHDGSVRLYNATFPALSLIFSLEGQIHDQKVVGFGAPVSKLDFCDSTLTLAVGNDRGLVRVYNLMDSSHEASFPFVTNTNRKVINLRQGEGHYCQAVFSLLDSPIHSMQFAKCGAKLVVGFDSGHVALLDMNALSVLFIIDCQVGSKSPVMSVSWIEVTDSSIPEEHLSHSETRAKEMIFSLTNDSILNIIDGHNGSMINAHPWQPKRKSKAISMYVIEGSTSNSISVDGKHPDESAKDASTNAEPAQKTSLETVSHDSKHHPSSRIALSTETFMDSTILISCEDSLRLYSTKDVVQGKNKTICKVKHANPCCWTSVLSKDGRNCGVVLLFRTGEIHIRSLPGLDLVQKNSLMSILRWNLKSNLEKISTSDNGLIMLANGSELAFISVLSAENLLRIPESLPCLHDKLLAAAADAAFSFSSTPKKKQGIKSGKLNDIVKGFIAGRTNHSGNISCSPGFDFSHLESVFAKPPFSDKPASISENQEAVELNIDDIVIDDDPLPPEANATSQEATKKQTERQRLLGTADSAEPRIRTPTEIRAHYRKAGDASSVAADARNKLMERQEKLERISRRTAELQSGAEDFASMANELVKIMESRNRKWWQL